MDFEYLNDIMSDVYEDNEHTHPVVTLAETIRNLANYIESGSCDSDVIVNHTSIVTTYLLKPEVLVSEQLPALVYWYNENILHHLV